MKFVTEEEVIAINRLMIQHYSPREPIGLKDRGLLNSSLQRMNHTVFGADAYPTVFEKAAALFHSLINNHCFLNANKRTAFATLQLFLGRNGYVCSIGTADAIELCVSTATEEMDIVALASLIKQHAIVIK